MTVDNTRTTASPDSPSSRPAEGSASSCHSLWSGALCPGGGAAYKLERFGFDKTQADILWTAGLSYRFQL